MSKTTIRIVCSILIMLLVVVGISGCAGRPEPEYASAITENILLAVNGDDYAGFSEDFDQAMKEAMTEAAFEQLRAVAGSIIGDYTPGSKQFWKVIDEDQYISVYYRAKFASEPQEVTVRVVFQEVAEQIYVSGLWFDSPKLRGE